MVTIFETGNTTEVFNFKVYSIEKDEFISSSRYATSHAIGLINGVAIGMPIEVPNKDLKDGFTEKNYTIKLD